ncbi:alpha/beta-type small acid-soluble spore protein [Paenibacillus sp. N1-5-1-14]|uniref:alpha/beta-type small acid-soluble spore protein n=1 Tax=Paenibacillus radicibacter TaxID=2972488 RepID=UPI0021599DF7|nr:alpha/beta-type small acid-soluble spore protein [Paenibacillus radicibacter]MCR8645057.1 alpha/beta-type small acid-soluble spore protein [Paenibacillus radicibacter]
MARNRQLVPGCQKALHAMKHEFAAEMGLYGGGAGLGDVHSEFASELGAAPSGGAVSGKSYWGNYSSRDMGYIGGSITKRLIQQAEDTLFTL